MLTCITPSSAIFLDALMHNVQQTQYLECAILQKPKFIKRVETDDLYQIQLFKDLGNFRSYKLRVSADSRNPFVVNLVVESFVDGFKKVFQFLSKDIDIDRISWQQYERHSALILNVPKRRQIFVDLFSVMPSNLTFTTTPKADSKKSLKNTDFAGREVPVQVKMDIPNQITQTANINIEKLNRAREYYRDDTSKQFSTPKREIASTEHGAFEAVKQAQLKQKRKCAHETHNESISHAAKKDGEKISKLSKFEKQQQLNKEEAQKYLYALIGGALITGKHGLSLGDNETKKATGNLNFETEVSSCSCQSNEYSFVPGSSSELTASAENSISQDEVENTNQETESINSEECERLVDDDTNYLKRHPSMEEVEDEEFVFLRKKFSE